MRTLSAIEKARIDALLGGLDHKIANDLRASFINSLFLLKIGVFSKAYMLARLNKKTTALVKRRLLTRDARRKILKEISELLENTLK